VAYDGVGKTTAAGSMTCLSRRGWLVVFGNASGPVPAIEPLALMRGGSLVLTRPTLHDFIATTEAMEAAAESLFAMIGSGKVKPQIGQRFALKDAADAHRALEARQTVGSTLLIP
jgi:NADPH2:quinone reductase